MSDLLLLASVFGVTFAAELPDKSLFASLVLGTRYRPGHVWLGVAAAFALHVGLAVTVGGLLTLAPRFVIDGVSAALFLGGAAWMVWSGAHEENEPGPDAARRGAPDPAPGLSHQLRGGLRRRVGRRHPDHDRHVRGPLPPPADHRRGRAAGPVGGVRAGRVRRAKLLARVPGRWIRLGGTVTLTLLGVYSLVQAIRGIA